VGVWLFGFLATLCSRPSLCQEAKVPSGQGKVPFFNRREGSPGDSSSFKWDALCREKKVLGYFGHLEVGSPCSTWVSPPRLHRHPPGKYAQGRGDMWIVSPLTPSFANVNRKPRVTRSRGQWKTKWTVRKTREVKKIQVAHSVTLGLLCVAVWHLWPVGTVKPLARVGLVLTRLPSLFTLTGTCCMQGQLEDKSTQWLKIEFLK
jgi:hypothetical protein